jgi:hypothetical protein
VDYIQLNQEMVHCQTFFERDSESTGSIKGDEFINQLSYYQLLKQNFAS